jgi:hypothetical protein
LYAAFFGFFTHPIPLLPYNGMTERFTARLALPVVRALTDRLIDGIRIPIFKLDHSLLIKHEVAQHLLALTFAVISNI